MQELTISLTVDEANQILAHLGELPSKFGVYPLLVKIKEQAEKQLPKAETPAVTQ